MLKVGAKGLSDPFWSGTQSPLPQQTITRLGPSSSYEAAVVRLLLGSADIVDAGNTVLLAQRTNYLVLGTVTTKVKTENGVRQTLKKMGVDWRALDRHLRRSLTHQKYFKEIACELVEYFERRRTGQCTVAFLHLYRFLERIAFVFPLLFAVRSASYPGAFTVLKDFFKGGVESELRLLRNFQESSIESAQLDAPMDLDFSGLDSAVSASAYSVARRCVADDDVISDASPVLTLRSRGLLDLLINLRNRFFHYSVSNGSNISLVEIGDSDRFFAAVNETVLNWLSVVFLVVLIEKAK